MNYSFVVHCFLRFYFADPAVITSHNPITTVNESSHATLTCTATGKPTPYVIWLKDGVAVHTHGQFRTPQLSYRDNGTCYTCVAINEILPGDTKKYCLNVQCKY